MTSSTRKVAFNEIMNLIVLINRVSSVPVYSLIYIQGSTTVHNWRLGWLNLYDTISSILK